jgi:hypothetical protein
MNYRVERVLLTFQEEIPGLDPAAAIDPNALADCYTDFDAQHLGLQPLSDYYIADFTEVAEPYIESRRWYESLEGLKTVRGLLKHYRAVAASGRDPLGRSIETIGGKIRLLERLEAVLSEADERGIKFCLLVK